MAPAPGEVPLLLRRCRGRRTGALEKLGAKATAMAHATMNEADLRHGGEALRSAG